MFIAYVIFAAVVFTVIAVSLGLFALMYVVSFLLVRRQRFARTKATTLAVCAALGTLLTVCDPELRCAKQYPAERSANAGMWFLGRCLRCPLLMPVHMLPSKIAQRLGNGVAPSPRCAESVLPRG